MAIKWETETIKRPHRRALGVRRRGVYWYAIWRRRLIRLWRRLTGKLAGDPTPDATLRHLREKLQQQEHDVPEAEAEVSAEAEKELEKVQGPR